MLTGRRATPRTPAETTTASSRSGSRNQLRIVARLMSAEPRVGPYSATTCRTPDFWTKPARRSQGSLWITDDRGNLAVLRSAIGCVTPQPAAGLTHSHYRSDLSASGIGNDASGTARLSPPWLPSRASSAARRPSPGDRFQSILAVVTCRVLNRFGRSATKSRRDHVVRAWCRQSCHCSYRDKTRSAGSQGQH